MAANVSWLANVMRHPYGLGIAFGIGVAFAGVLYALVSVYVFGVIERAWGAGGSFQVVVMLGIAAAVLCGLAFGTTLQVLGTSERELKLSRPGTVASAFGAVALLAGGGFTSLARALAPGSMLMAVAIFGVCAVVAAIVYRFLYVVPKSAAS